ncbi:uncharacterized protein [Penaeus vannamei]|uniref:uncharacterized protein isoform X1 n=1 Tax=Penaeus vannamei TaxID=6689 RepID=UPI000F65AACC|nr:uncharacterized protein LOC113821721 isoform X1 [Penaeus vannamei]XP_037784250.1 uncharacterized protein LOC119580277 isoform X1 [Penaeus monodon]
MSAWTRVQLYEDPQVTKMNGTTCFDTTAIMDSPPMKVWLYPEEGWARASCNSHWLLKTPWWSRRHCYVLEVEGTKRHKTVARVMPAREGEVVVEGTFRGIPDPDFRLVLTSSLTPADQRRGYHMTGSLERGDRKTGLWQTTHLAVTKRSGFS